MTRALHLSRRHFLAAGAGTAGALLLPTAGLSVVTPAGLKPLLDRVAALPSRADMLRAFNAQDASTFSPEEATILRMIALGMEREEVLHRAFPFGKADGSSPYVV